MTFQLQPVVATRIAVEVCSEHLWHHSQSCPPLVQPISGNRPNIQSSIFPTSVLGKFVMITEFQAEIPMRSKLARQTEADFNLAFCRFEVIRPFGRMSQVESPFPVSVTLTKDYSLLQLGFISSNTRFKIKCQADRMIGRVKHHQTIFERDTVEMPI